MKGFLVSFHDNVSHLNGFPGVLSAQGKAYLPFQCQRHATVSKMDTYLTYK